MCETKVMKLMEKSSFQLIDKDHDFIMIDYYRTCGFKIGIGVNPFSKLGYGAIVWSTALGLCQYFEKERIHFSDKKVIELGAGTGMLSILAALLGGNITITDKSELLMQIQWNVSLNIPPSYRHRVQVRALRWGHDQMLFPSDYDYILCSDLMYFPHNTPLILKTLLHLSNEKTTIYFASAMPYGQNVAKEGHVTLSQYFHHELVCRYDFECVEVYRMRLNTPPKVHLNS